MARAVSAAPRPGFIQNETMTTLQTYPAQPVLPPPSLAPSPAKAQPKAILTPQFTRAELRALVLDLMG